MKIKSYLAVIAVMLCGSVFAQDLYFDKNDEKFRMINCTKVNITSPQEELELYVSLSYSHSYEYDFTFWNLGFTVKSELPKKFAKDSRLLIKLLDDSLIELKILTETDSYLGFEVGRRASCEVVYRIKEDDILALTKGVKKLRFETTLRNIDIELNEDVMGEVIRKSYKIIQEALSIKPKGFTEDF